MGRVRTIPDWIKFSIPSGEQYKQVQKHVAGCGLHTVCLEARCPNIGECFSKGHATFLIMGNICTRNCKYCAVTKGQPQPLNIHEPQNIARAVANLNLEYVVITSVTRDDLEDGGAFHFVKTIEAIRTAIPDTKIEVLIPDFKFSQQRSLTMIMDAHPDVINHNIEVVKSYYHTLRPKGDYQASLTVLAIVTEHGFIAKSGLMIGFGETMDDIINTLEDVYSAGCRVLTVGQYCASHRGAYPVHKYYTPEEFKEIETIAYQIGFMKVLAAPLVRSSYRAGELFS
ncbi:MAG TPA: lipoyl synthase [Spirochaetota bacterium]|nr:lipoyl synthase [Spirochaetota bacterium]